MVEECNRVTNTQIKISVVQSNLTSIGGIKLQ